MLGIISISIPTHWTAEQADWAYGLVSRLQEAIWTEYDDAILSLDDARADEQFLLDFDARNELTADDEDFPW